MLEQYDLNDTYRKTCCIEKIIKTVIHLNKRWITVLFILNLTVTDFIAIETGTVCIIFSYMKKYMIKSVQAT